MLFIEIYACRAGNHAAGFISSFVSVSTSQIYKKKTNANIKNGFKTEYIQEKVCKRGYLRRYQTFMTVQS